MITKKTGIGIGLLLAFVVYVVLLTTVDVAAIGPNGTAVGFSHLNQTVFDAFGTDEAMYELTELLGGVSLITVLMFALLGAIQLIQRKSLFKVDQRLYALAGLYAATAFFYVLFEKLIINYRPVIMSGETEPEASFPSSHTMLVCVAMESTILTKLKKR